MVIIIDLESNCSNIMNNINKLEIIAYTQELLICLEKKHRAN